MNSDPSLRIGAVSYFNSRPLVYGLERFVPNAKVVYDLPSRLADQLARGALDVALIPSIEYFQRADYMVVSDACIGCQGPVWSVKLYCRVSPAKIRRVALDEGSRTSVALVRILLEQRYGVRPELEPLSLGHGLTDTDADAVLMIGDRAMRAPAESFTEVWDLGEQWTEWSGLPFVFAMWVARRETRIHDLDRALAAARDEGILNLREIAAVDAGPSVADVPFAVRLSYLRDNLYFHLEAPQRKGLELFYQHAVRLGLAKPGLELRNYDSLDPRQSDRRRAFDAR